jgi:alanyl-tRNA synthetase
MTSLLYYQDSKLQKWTTTIKQYQERDGFFYLILAETAFYPEGGGQPSDRGTIQGISVLDVQKEGDDVVHKLPNLPETLTVECELDWVHRFDHMQHHSGQHLLSAVCRELYQLNTLSFHLGKDYVTIDVDSADVATEQTTTIEQLTNQYIYENRTITSYFVTKDELLKLPVVKLPKVTENIRIVETKGIEYNPCGGTHVKRTGQIGLIKILKTEKQKNSTRIYFKCGMRALNDFSEALEILSVLSTKFSAGRTDILDRIDKSEQQQKQLQAENEELKKENAAYIIDRLMIEEKNGWVSHIFQDKSLKDLQMLAALMANEKKRNVLFASTIEQKLVLASNGKQNIHCGQFFKQHLAEFGGKGGGNKQTAQAGFSDHDSMMKFYYFSENSLKTE